MTFALPLAELRALSNEFLPDTATIQRVTETSTGDGQSSSWATSSTVPCRVSLFGRGGGSEVTGAADQIQAIGQRVIVLPSGTDVTTRDRIVVGAHTYEVADAPERSYSVVRAVVAREVS